MSRQIFVNLAVQDIKRTTDFFSKLGFSFDPRFTGENSACLIVGDESFVMLMDHAHFSDFTKKTIIDPKTAIEAIVSISADSKEEVDRVADAALASGGSPMNDPQDMGFMYLRSFQDPDGHHWEVAHMDVAAFEAMHGQSQG
jgi:predicted lactoylglutathione lyase